MDKPMEKRFKFQCWNCPRSYSLLREITEEMRLFTACPYCGAEAVVELEPYKKTDPVNVYRSGNDAEKSLVSSLDLPDVLPTEQTPSES